MKSVNQQPLISVIVPVYKVEQYLDRCVKSIVNQTYKNLEIILIDDGSPDNSPAICDEWAKKDDRIKVIHKENGGVSRARNLGMELAKGEYISFIDSDDWVHPDFIKILYNAIQDTDSQIAACDMRFLDNVDDVKYEIATPEFKCFEPEYAIESMGEPHGFSAGPCNKLYHKDMLLNEAFVVDKRHEDEFFTYKILAKAQKLVFVYAELYFYWQHSDSFMHSISESHLDMLEAFLEHLDFCENKFPRLYKKSKSGICISFMNMLFLLF